MLVYRSKNIFALTGNKNKYIVHACDFDGSWEGEFAKEMSKVWSYPQKVYPNYLTQGIVPGDVQIVPVKEDTFVCNLVGGIGKVEYHAIEKGMGIIFNYVNSNGGGTVHMPYLIGCGKGGCDTEKVEEILKEVSSNYNMPVFCHRKPK
jgi:hypothetical protein